MHTYIFRSHQICFLPEQKPVSKAANNIYIYQNLNIYRWTSSQTGYTSTAQMAMRTSLCRSPKWRNSRPRMNPAQRPSVPRPPLSP